MLTKGKIKDGTKSIDWMHADNITALSEAWADRGTGYYHNAPSGGWQGSSDIKRLLQSGDDDCAAASDKVMRLIEDQIDFGATRRRNIRAVTGGVPNVAATLAGHPKTMRRRVKAVDSVAPLHVFVCVGAASSASVKSIQMRGAATLALVRLLSAARPTRLTLLIAYRDAGGGMVTVDVDTAPLDLARAAWALTQPEFLRRAMFHAYTHMKGRPGMDWGFGPLGDWNGRPDLAAQALGVSEYIASPRLTGSEPEWQSEEAAAAWVMEKLGEMSSLAA